MCGYDFSSDRFVCACIEGFEGDGVTCVPMPPEEPTAAPGAPTETDSTEEPEEQLPTVS